MSKKQWKVVKDLPCQFSTKSTWSQEDSDANNRDVSEIRSVLPTKTSATRQISDLENIPQNGPFLLNFANIPYEADETAIKQFFQAYDVINVIKSDLKRGTGIIEFNDLNGLSGALGLSEKIFISRPIRLSIGSKEDLSRIKTGGPQRGRFPNQPRNAPPTINEDSDNWRVKKSPPVSQPPSDVYSPRNNDRQNWREKSSSIRNNEEKVSSENSENWRKGTTRDAKSGNFNRRNPTMQESSKPISAGERSERSERPERQEPKDNNDHGKETKKVSIFGDAKPVDTLSKDMEIEQKIEQQKKQVDESGKTESTPANNAWTHKKHANNPANSATVDRSDKFEGRGSKAPSSRAKANITGIQRNEQPAKPAEPVKSEPTEPPKVVEPQLAPVPVNNIWESRKKARELNSQTPVDRNNSASKPGLDKSLPQSIPPEKPAPNPAEHQQTILLGDNSVQLSPQSNPVTMTTTTTTTTPTTTTTTTESKAIQKPPVVISANGPFLDPKSRTPHHSMSDNSSNKTPTAVPINKSPSDVYKDSTDSSRSVSVSKPFSSALSSSSSSEQQQPKPTTTTTPINACGKQSSWANGPPKGLIEKTEINQ